MKLLHSIILAAQVFLLDAFIVSAPPHLQCSTTTTTTTLSLRQSALEHEPTESTKSVWSRRTWIRQGLVLATISSSLATAGASPARAATRPPLPDLLYTILRVREATEQESRLIQSGKFKDVQRANIKLAIRFMVENYRLADAFVAAAAYLDGNERRIAAGDVGQAAVQNLVTILEYFDAADVQNLKVGSNSLAGKETLVLKGLDAARRNIDEFLTFFPAGEIDPVKTKIETENKLNLEEFDPALGVPINVPTTKV